jgi:hypothetical protein
MVAERARKVESSNLELKEYLEVQAYLKVRGMLSPPPGHTFTCQNHPWERQCQNTNYRQSLGGVISCDSWIARYAPRKRSTNHTK